MTRPADSVAGACPICGSIDSMGLPGVCSRCGAKLGMAPARLEAGTRVLDRYVIDGCRPSFIGMNLYEAHADGNGRDRVLIAEKSADAPDLLRDIGLPVPTNGGERPHPFRTEHALLSKFDYSGIIRSRGIDTQDDRAYLVLDYVEGEPLGNLGQCSEGEVRAWGLQLCQIVSLLHRQGIAHNGIEPSSFVIDSQRRLKLMRFDRCRPLNTFRSDAELRPIPGFSAPEVLHVNPETMVDVRSDVYSIGALLYTMLSGEVIPDDLGAGHELELYPKLVIAPGFERILNRALAHDPEDRYRSVNEMKLALADLNVTVNVRTGHFTDVGKLRELNEDSLLVLNLTQYFESVQTHIGLYIVSDGMGGEAAGEVASRVTVRAIAEWITDKLISASLRSTHGERIAAETETGGIRLASSTGADVRASELLTNSILHANHEVLQYARHNPHTRGLGATVTAAMLVGNSLTVGHVGDSRAYVLSARGLEQITEDHSIVERMVREGQIERDEARFHPYRNVIYRSIGCREEIEIDIVRCMLRSGDTFILCSDGLNGMLTDDEIAAIVQRNPEPSQSARELVVAANAHGGEDNTSVVVVTIL